jgi:D-alanyl-D-alanine carboxypeptidase
MKKTLTIIFFLVLMFTNVKVFAASPPPVVADSALLIDTSSGRVLYEKNKDTVYYPASTTKIMTALLVLEHCKLDDKVIIGENPSKFIDGDKIYIFKDEEFTVDQLLHALLIASANDVAVALAEHVSGSVEAFADLMNEKA